MPKISLVPVQSGTSITADAIPDSVKKEIEELWEAFQKSTGHETRVEFETGLDENGKPNGMEAEDRNLWLRQAVSYGRQRMNAQGQSEALKIRVMPKRNLPDHVKYITIARDIPKDAETNTNTTSR